MKKSKDTITIKKKDIEKVFKIIVLCVLFAMSIIFLINFIFPLALGIVHMFLGLLRTWTSSSNEYIKFFGGIFFLYLFWKVFVIIINLWDKATSFIISKYKTGGKIIWKKKPTNRQKEHGAD
jgi:predicted membrane protein